MTTEPTAQPGLARTGEKQVLEREATRPGLVFRPDVDPVQLYISIAALGFFYMSNRFTLSTIFGRDLGAAAELRRREGHIVEMVLAYLAHGAEAPAALPLDRAAAGMHL